MGFIQPPFIISILIALAVHEWAHAYAAWKLGDPTAKYEGRLTVNPIAHLDPLGTLMFIIVGFGWGKPVPVDARYFKRPLRDMAITAFAGPLSNLILAIIFILLLAFLTGGQMPISIIQLVGLSLVDANPLHTIAVQICASSVFINLALMAFNLLPVAPLDGSKILRPFIPKRYEAEYEAFLQRGPFFLLLLIVLGRVANVPVLTGWVFGIGEPIFYVLKSIVT